MEWSLKSVGRGVGHETHKPRVTLDEREWRLGQDLKEHWEEMQPGSQAQIQCVAGILKRSGCCVAPGGGTPCRSISQRRGKTREVGRERQAWGRLLSHSEKSFHAKHVGLSGVPCDKGHSQESPSVHTAGKQPAQRCAKTQRAIISAVKRRWCARGLTLSHRESGKKAPCTVWGLETHGGVCFIV